MYGRDTFIRFASSVCDTPSSFILSRMRRRNAEPILSIAVNGICRVVSFNAEAQRRRVRREFYGRCAAGNAATGVWGLAPRYKTLLMCYYEIGSQCEASSNRLCVLCVSALNTSTRSTCSTRLLSSLIPARSVIAPYHADGGGTPSLPVLHGFCLSLRRAR